MTRNKENSLRNKKNTFVLILYYSDIKWKTLPLSFKEWSARAPILESTVLSGSQVVNPRLSSLSKSFETEVLGHLDLVYFSKALRLSRKFMPIPSLNVNNLYLWVYQGLIRTRDSELLRISAKHFHSKYKKIYFLY